MTLHWSAVWRPALSVGLLVLPLAILQQVLVANGSMSESSSAALLFTLAYLFLAATAGFGAARLVPDRLLQHGAAAGALVYALVQGVGILRRVLMGEATSPVRIAYLLLLMATCGTLGGLVARRWQRADAIRNAD